MARPARISDANALLAAARKSPSPVYLLVGEPSETETVARSLIDLLVPPERRSFNLEIHDGRTTPMSSILDSLRMPGLFSGTKVLWVKEPTVFVAGEKRGDTVDLLFAAWSDDRPAEAAERLAALAAEAGWTQDRLAATDWAGLKATEAAELCGRTLDAGERQVLAAVGPMAAAEGVRAGAARDESGLLDDFLGAGVPAGNVLVFTAAAVDRRKRVVKTLEGKGALVELGLERDRRGALSAESVDRVVERVLSAHGKRAEPAARRLIAARAGNDPATFAAELEKLCLYVGEAGVVREADVRQSVRDLSESWVFDFTRALAERSAGEAIALLRSLFAAGEPPLRLLALVARELRLLLLARDCLTETLAGSWSPGAPYNVFRDRLLPKLSEEERGAFGGVHPYALYLCLQNASRVETRRLERAVLELARLDVRIKSGAGDPRLLFEAFVLGFCRRPAAA